MKAERTRRATVTTAEGAREADITRAEGERQAAILRAEAVKQQQILEAEGAAMAVRELAEAEKYRNIATAEGEAEAIRSVYGAIHDGNPSNDLIAIRYLDALGKIADGRATKIFLPVDTTNVMGSIAGISELFRSTGDPPS
jgi:regulator of protease activity HflC (stomatin/prohibitin superfamily)